MRASGALARGAGALGAAAALAAADASVVEPNLLATTVEAIPAGPLAEALGGATIVHLSDLHLTGFGARERRLLALLEEIGPDLVVMTGDYADSEEGVAALRGLAARIRPPLGVVAVPGNNDYFRGRQDAIFAALAEAGAVLLVNEAVVLEGRAGRFAVAGVDDPFFGRDDVEAALRGVPPGTPAILLAHSPAVLAERGEGILLNAGDAEGPWGRGWFWQDGSHLRDPVPDIAFVTEGRRRLRIQRREDGAGVGAVRLVPAGGPPPAAPAAGASGGRRFRGVEPPAAAGTVEVDLCAPGAVDARGSWSLRRLPDSGCALVDGPDLGRMRPFATADPEDRADVLFDAPSGVAYRVWARIFSPTSTGRSDSVYLQFDDAVDPSGAPRFRIGAARPGASSPDLHLVLAGHTHGGQVRLPWIGPLDRSLLPGPYVAGRYDAGGAMIYVSRGIGTSYLPVRFACPPEVVVLTPPRSPRA